MASYNPDDLHNDVNHQEQNPTQSETSGGWWNWPVFWDAVETGSDALDKENNSSGSSSGAAEKKADYTIWIVVGIILSLGLVVFFALRK